MTELTATPCQLMYADTRCGAVLVYEDVDGVGRAAIMHTSDEAEIDRRASELARTGATVYVCKPKSRYGIPTTVPKVEVTIL